ncbi:Os05g0122100 [Oryza sativa Japonica Group]|uniref:Os05g0122100 protein n=1 Tax=Oryza sativa subsp. japonica TaxID=39947 RepID=A0A0P0WHL4_ORYSJ|nr:Os05g0122100 [Oryza sativa Japonica Group]
MDDVRRLDGVDQDLLLCVEDDVVATTTSDDGAWADDLEERAENLERENAFRRGEQRATTISSSSTEGHFAAAAILAERCEGDSLDSKTSCDEISKEELLRSLKLKLNKKKVSVDCNLKRKRSETTEVDFKNQLDSALLEIFRDNVLIGMKRKLYCHKSKIETGTAKATFLQRLDSAIGVDLPQEIKKDINELLLHHLGPDENCIDDRVKNLLIDIFDLLSNASKPSVPDNTDFNPSEDDKNKLNDGSIINEANICETPKIHSTCDDNAILNEQSPMLCKDTKTPERSCSEKDKNSDVDGIMRKLCKPGMISSPPKITKARFVGFNERKPIYFDHEKPQFQIWDSDDDNINQEDNLRSEVTPRHGLKSSKIVPDSYSPACPTELNKTKIIPLDLSQNLYDLSQNQENNSENEDQLIMVTLEDSETQSQHNEKENLPVQQQYTKTTENKKDSPEVVFLGERQSTENCLDITSKTNVLYNKINTFIVNPDKKLKMCTASPERVLLCNVDRNVGQCSSSQKPQHDLRRILQPARYSTDPYSPEKQSFCVTAYDRQLYNAVCKISKSSFQECAEDLIQQDNKFVFTCKQ